MELTLPGLDSLLYLPVVALAGLGAERVTLALPLDSLVEKVAHPVAKALATAALRTPRIAGCLLGALYCLASEGGTTLLSGGGLAGLTGPAALGCAGLALASVVERRYHLDAP